MGKRLIKDSTLDAIASAIRTKGGADGLMTPTEMPEKILNIPVNVEGGADLPELSNPAGSGEILSGYQAINGNGIAITGSHVCPTVGDLTGDGTATPDQVAKGATFYAGGEKREGTVYTVGSQLNEFGDLSASDDRIILSTSFSDPTLFPAGTKHNVRAYLSNFGDATADDVLKGKTFTSAAGLEVVGTAALAKVFTGLAIHESGGNTRFSCIDGNSIEVPENFLLIAGKDTQTPYVNSARIVLRIQDSILMNDPPMDSSFQTDFVLEGNTLTFPAHSGFSVSYNYALYTLQ